MHASGPQVRRWSRATALGAGLLVALAGCGANGAADRELGVELALSPSPPRVGWTELRLALTDASGAPLPGADVRVEGNMSHPGMVPELAQAEETSPGLYLANLELTMGGDWFLVVTAVTESGLRYERVVDVPGVLSERVGPER